MRKALIAAFDVNLLVGAEGRMPWNIPEDMRLFRRLTMGKPVIMGRKTYESIGKPLPGRTNIVLSTRRGLGIEGCIVVHNLAAAFDAAEGVRAEECMVIGGGKVYEQAIWHVDRLYLSRINHRYSLKKAGGVYFPRNDWLQRRRPVLVELQQHPKVGAIPAWDYMVLDLDDATAADSAESHSGASFLRSASASSPPSP